VFTPNRGEIHALLDVNIVDAELGGCEAKLRALASAYAAAKDAVNRAAKQLLGELVAAETNPNIDQTVLDEIWDALQKKNE
jgi:hypothetical protein